MTDKAKVLVDRLIESDSGLTYHTKIRSDGVEVWGLDTQGDLQADDAAAYIQWELDLESRSWGVKDLNVLLKKIDVQWMVDNLRQEDGDKNKTQQRVVWEAARNDGWTASVNYERESHKLPLTLYPRRLEVHVLERRLVVDF